MLKLILMAYQATPLQQGLVGQECELFVCVRVCVSHLCIFSWCPLNHIVYNLSSSLHRSLCPIFSSYSIHPIHDIHYSLACIMDYPVFIVIYMFLWYNFMYKLWSCYSIISRFSKKTPYAKPIPKTFQAAWNAAGGLEDEMEEENSAVCGCQSFRSVLFMKFWYIK